MKLIIAILPDNDSDSASKGLIDAGFRVTKIASTGGFLRKGSTTLLIGVEDAQVDDAIHAIRQNSAPPIEPALRQATLFVIPVERFEQI